MASAICAKIWQYIYRAITMPNRFRPSPRLMIALLPLLALLITPQSALAATPGVTSLSANTTTVPRYSKFELTFAINKTYPADSRLPYYFYDPADTPAIDPNRKSPYGIDGITIDTVFVTPSGQTLTVPSFYYQDYSRSRVNNREVLTVVGIPGWKTRFTPSEVGTYKYYITITDKEGTTRYPTSGELTFTATSSSAKGFIRASKRDPRFLDYDNGTSFIGISGQAQWWSPASQLKSYDYEDKFNQYRQSGINLVRIWDENDGYALSLESTYETVPTDEQVICCSIKGTFIDQPDAFREDKIIESAEANGVAIELSSHGDVYWTWDASIYGHDGYDKWNTNPVGWNNPFHMNYWKRNFRYRVARFGYSPAILSWELWNEHGHITPDQDLYKFYQQYAEYQRVTDPYQHLRTTSQGGQAFSPGFWSSPANDIANYHDYMMISRYDASLTNDEANFVYRFSQCLRYIPTGRNCGLGLGDGTTWVGAPKPWIWGEIGVLQAWDVADPAALNGEGGVRARLNELWAGLFGPLGTGPIEWNTADSTTLARIYQGTKVIRSYFATVDYNAHNFDHLPTPDLAIPNYTGEKLTTSNANVRAMALRSADKRTVLLWVQNKNYTWKNYTSTPAAQNATITVPSIPNGTYRVELWNTETGEIATGTSNITANGSLVLPVNNLQKSVAVKLISTAVPSPACDADINQDKLVDLSDYSLLVSNFFKSNAGRSDINKDGLVDLSDYTLLTKSFMQSCSN